MIKEFFNRPFFWITGITDRRDTLRNEIGLHLFHFTMFILMILLLYRLRTYDRTLQQYDWMETVLAFLFILTGGYLAWLSFKYSSSKKIAKILRAYIFGAFMFAGLYFCSYNQDKSSFSFSSGILSKSELARIEAVDEDIRLHYRKSIASSDFFEWVAKMSPEDYVKFRSNRINRMWSISDGTWVRLITRKNIDELDYGVEFTDSDGRLLMWSGAEPSPQYQLVGDENISKRHYLRAIIDLKKEIASNTELLRKELAGTDRRAFNLLDFVYFSFVTVTTLGYGDIVPNTTWIRLLIVGQILFGLCLVLIASPGES